MRTAILIAATMLALPVLAQQRDDRPPGMPMKPDFAAALSIPPEKAAQVEAVLQREREAMRKVHDAARAELSQVLDEEQMARLEQLMPRRPRGPGGDRGERPQIR